MLRDDYLDSWTVYGLPNDYAYGLPNDYAYGLPNDYAYGLPNDYAYGLPNDYAYGLPNDYAYFKTIILQRWPWHSTTITASSCCAAATTPRTPLPEASPGPTLPNSPYHILSMSTQIEPRLDVTPQSTGARFSAASSSPGLADQNVGTGAPSLPGVSYGLDTLC
ncbi:unnamed protein product [Leuciscus chuanchicus]